MSNPPRLSLEEIRMLALCERLMDQGLLPFVMLNGQRTASTPDVMKELGLEQGQTITPMIFVAMLEHRLAHATTAMALKKARETKEPEK